MSEDWKAIRSFKTRVGGDTESPEEGAVSSYLLDAVSGLHHRCIIFKNEVSDMTISYYCANFRNDPSHPRDRINLPTEEENLVLETIVGGQDINIWAILMPAVYQLVPGSIIAKLWFNAIFPPVNVEILASTILNSEDECFPGTGQCNTQPYDGVSILKVPQESTESVFSNLMGKRN